MKKILLLLSLFFSVTAFADENPFSVLESGDVYKVKFREFTNSSLDLCSIDIYSDNVDHYKVRADRKNQITELLAIASKNWNLSDVVLKTKKTGWQSYLYFVDFACNNLPYKALNDSHFLPDGEPRIYDSTVTKWD